MGHGPQAKKAVASALREINGDKYAPNVEQLDSLLSFAAIMFVRVPSFRPFVLKLEESIVKGTFAEALKSRETWEAFLRRADVASDTPGASYEECLQFQQQGYSLSGILAGDF